MAAEVFPGVIPEGVGTNAKSRKEPTDGFSGRLTAVATWFGGLPLAVEYLFFFAAVVLGHLTLLRLPYYWDEGGYYIPAALDFFHHGTLIPTYTNAHPPLPNVVLGSLWHVTGYSILATRLAVCAFAAAGLLAIFRLACKLVGAPAATAVATLTAVYPIWYAQSTLAHADIFAAAFTLIALAIYVPATGQASLASRLWVSVLLSLAALSKETAIVWPATLAALELLRAFCNNDRGERRDHLQWLTAMCAPVLPLLAWYGYHRWRTGFTFGNPEYLRYNATANFTVAHVFLAVRYRFLHLFTQRDMWLPLVLTGACLLLSRREENKLLPLPRRVLGAVGVLILSNWLFFSVLGGALLTRYLLPVYPLLLLVCVAMWQSRTTHWPWLSLLTGAVFMSAWWLSPPTSYAPEDCLSYRDMIVVHQRAIAFLDEHFPDATVLTAWPASSEIFKPELGYTDRRIKAFQIENFSREEVLRAAAEPECYDTALVITTHFVEPGLRRWLLAHPNNVRTQEYFQERDMTPEEVAMMLRGEIAFKTELNGEYAAVLRFPRSFSGPVMARNSSSTRPQ